LTRHLTFDNQLRELICENLNRFERRSIDSSSCRHAAVAITLVERQIDANFADIPFKPSDADQAAFLLTIRASKLRDHAGQRSFPGGRIDAGETPEQTALRELQEEVGLELSPEDILGRLDDYSTRSGFVITPVVIWGGRAASLTACPEEVASIHRIPLRELLREDAPILESIVESEHPVLKMPIGNDWVAAPTGAMAYQFREVAILGNQTRVAHFEAPLFAWV
jgi:8-oxo-dGTP pyrophosphatase MutT (NUDIX family)